MRDLAWTPEGASITIVGQAAPLQTWPTNLNMIAINSVSTAPEGVTASVIDVGAGAEADFAALDVKGKIVLAEGNARSIFVRAMQKGAAGVLAKTQEPAVKQALIASTQEAQQLGIFGAPTWIVRESGKEGFELFWGQDRVQLVERALTSD